mgnify:CR=1 FL=1
MRYKCAKCKNIFDGDPAFKNNAGTFCQSCKNEIHEKAHTARREILAEQHGTCKYCGDIDLKNPSNQWADHTVCPKCLGWRDRSLVLIRHSDVAFKHIAKVEEREKKDRESRNAAKLYAKESEKSETKPIAIDRIARLEEMMEKLIKGLGGV